MERIILILICFVLLYIWAEIENKPIQAYKYTKRELKELEEIEKSLRELE